MRKRLISPTQKTQALHDRGWLELEQAALVEVTSEATGYPVPHMVDVLRRVARLNPLAQNLSPETLENLSNQLAG